MAIKPVDDAPELRKAILRARGVAEAAGELNTAKADGVRDHLPEEARLAIRELLRDGAYAAAAARVAGEDPELADQ